MLSLELAESLSIREYRLELAYSAARLNAVEETRGLAGEFEHAAEQFALLEAEEGRLDIARVETQAMVETADDAWDATVDAFRRRLLDLVEHNADHALYRRYFADVPSHVTSMSYAAEIMISKDLEAALAADEREDLRAFSDRLAARRGPLEASLRERTRLEVELAKFANRVSLAKALANKLRRITAANLEELAAGAERDGRSPARFFRARNLVLEGVDADGAASPTNGELEASV